MLCQCCWTQNRWERINGDSISDIEDLVMTEDGTIYFMLEGKNYYFRSKNYGDSWDLFHPHQTPYFGLVDIRKTYPFDNDNLIVYLEKCYCYMNLDSNNSFNLYPNSSNFALPYTRLLFDQKRNLYAYASNGLHRIDSSFDQDKIKDVKIFRDNILECFFYASEFSFVCTRDQLGLTKVYKISLSNSDTVFYSQILNQNIRYSYQIHINEQGDIFIAAGYALIYAHHDHPDFFYQYQVEKNTQLDNISRIETDINKNLYLFTDQGVYFSQKDTLAWKKLQSFSQGIPQWDFIKKIVIGDSTQAVILLDKHCSPTNLSVLNHKQQRWTTLDKWIDSRDIRNFAVDKNDFILAKFYNCDDGAKISKNGGHSYQDFRIEDEAIEEVFMNRKWTAYAISESNKVYYSENDYNNFTLMKSLPWKEQNDYILRRFSPLGSDKVLIVMNKKYIAGSSKLYITSNNGASWDHRCDYCFYGVENYAFTLFNQNEIVAYTPWTDTTWISNDLGKTWTQHPLLSKFKKYAVEQLPNGDIFVTGSYSRKLGLYRINTKNEVSLVDPLFDGGYGYFNSMHYPTIVAIYDGHGVHYISKDGGVTWEDFNGGLPKNDIDYVIVGQDFFAENGVYYRAIRNDGLYRTTKPLVNTQDIDSKSEKNLEDFLVLSQHQLRFVEPEKLVYFSIFDISGKELLHKNSDFNKAVDLSKLPAGFYILGFNNGENFSFKYFNSGE